MNRKILLLEPNYHNKYPPMGLMKLAMYYRLQQDQVVFYKGDFNDFIVSEWVEDAIQRLEKINTEYDENINWRKFTPEISVFIRSGKIEPDSEFEKHTVENTLYKTCLEYFRTQFRTKSYFKNPR